MHENEDPEPEESDDNWAPAGFGLRVVAYTYDSLIFGLLSSLFFLILFTLLFAGVALTGESLVEMLSGTTRERESTAVYMLIILFLLPTLLSVALPAVFESSRLAATPGKLLMGLAVTDLDGQDISLGTALKRNAWKFQYMIAPAVFITAMAAFCRIPFFRTAILVVGGLLCLVSILASIVGHLMIAFTSNKQGLHDQLARTLVLQRLDVSSKRRNLLSILALFLFASSIILGIVYREDEMEGREIIKQTLFGSSPTEPHPYAPVPQPTSTTSQGLSAPKNSSKVLEPTQDMREITQRATISLNGTTLSYPYAHAQIDKTGRNVEIVLTPAKLAENTRDELLSFPTLEHMSETSIQKHGIGAIIILKFGPFDQQCSKLSLKSYILRMDLAESGHTLSGTTTLAEYARHMSLADAQDVKRLSCIREEGNALSLLLQSSGKVLLAEGTTTISWDIDIDTLIR